MTTKYVIAHEQGHAAGADVFYWAGVGWSHDLSLAVQYDTEDDAQRGLDKAQPNMVPTAFEAAYIESADYPDPE